MHRLLVESALLDEGSPVLPAAAARHLKVLRPKDGEEIELFDGHGRSRVFKVQGSKFQVSGFKFQGECGLVAVSPTCYVKPETCNLTLFACVTKGSRWDWTIEKATELGVTRIVPVISERTIVRIPKGERAAKRERWMRIAEDAARQSDAKWLPEICEAVDFKDALPLVRETTCFIGALTNPPSPPFSEAIAKAVRRRGGQSPSEGGACIHAEAPEEDLCHRVSCAVFIGPEGDFTPEELAALMEIATPTSFGPTILRAETAAIYAVSVLRSLLI